MPINMPSTPSFQQSNFGMEFNSGVFISPLTRQQQTVERDGARWMASYALPAMNKAQAAPWRSFLMKLKGQVGTFYGYDPDHRTPLGSNIQVAASANYVNNGSAAGATVSTLPTGWSSQNGASVNVTVVGAGSVTVGNNTYPYVDVNIAGTASGGGTALVWPQSMAASSQVVGLGEQWTQSMYVQLLAGSAPGGFSLSLLEGNSGGSVLATQSQNITTAVNAATGAMTLISQTITTGQATVTRLRPQIFASFSTGQVINITLRMSSWQLEKGLVTPYIGTVGTPQTRNANARVFGAGQTGLSLIVRGFDANQVAALKEGDYFGLEGRLYCMTANADTDYRGVTTLNFSPALRSSPVNDALLTTVNPTCEMRLVDDGQATWDGNHNSILSMSFSAVEVI